MLKYTSSTTAKLFLKTSKTVAVIHRPTLVSKSTLLLLLCRQHLPLAARPRGSVLGARFQSPALATGPPGRGPADTQWLRHFAVSASLQPSPGLATMCLPVVLQTWILHPQPVPPCRQAGSRPLHRPTRHLQPTGTSKGTFLRPQL